jgi:phosphoadenosine phosphosulfate reductase
VSEILNQTASTPAVQSAEDKIRAAEQLVRQELEQTQRNICVTNSFQAEDMIVLHIVRQTLPDVSVIFLDTGYHFAEVYEYRNRMAQAWSMNLINLLPELSVPEQEAQFGILNQTDPSRCCSLRKVTPLFAALDRYELWFTGLRREQAKSRAALQPVEDFALPTTRTIRKISPLAEWTTKDVWYYAIQHNIPLLPLYDKGYSSIGCEPCTSLPLDPSDPRSGRWGGRKQECGIHLQST